MSEETYIQGAGGKLFIRSWLPASTPRGVIAICPGFNAHSGMYEWAGAQFAAQGFAAHALDLRGRGKSDGERFYVKSFDDYADDLKRVIDWAKTRNPDAPVFLLGHSAGGVTSCIYALSHQSEIEGLICESFAFEVPAPDFALAVLKGLAHVAPHTHSVALNNKDFSRDPAIVAAMNRDPLIAHEAQPTATMAALVHADERLRKSFGQIKLPLLILHGTADKAAKPAGSQLFYDSAGSDDKTLKLYEGGFHDLLNDIDRERVMGEIVAWIRVHVSVA